MYCKKCGSVMGNSDTECEICGWKNENAALKKSNESKHYKIDIQGITPVARWKIYSVLLIILGFIMLYKGLYYYNCNYLDPYEDVLWTDKERGVMASLPYFIAMATSFLSAVGTGIIYQIATLKESN